MSHLRQAIAEAAGPVRAQLESVVGAVLGPGGAVGTLLLTDAVTPLQGEALERHFGLVLPQLARHGGRLLHRCGDALLAVFAEAPRSVDAAVEIQQAVTEENAHVTREEDRVRLRVACHLGPVRLASEGGLMETLDALIHLERLALPTQIVVSDPVRAQLPSTLPLAHRGEVALEQGQVVYAHEVVWKQIARAHEALPQLDERYVVQSKLGAGGMATVWRARDERLGRDVAIKVLHRNLPFSSSMRERLQREARVAAALTHENVVQVYDVSVPEAGDSYIAMELVEGRTLRDYVEKLGPLPSYPAALVAYEVARGVGFAHARGVVHRDVKPDNVLISDRGAVKVGDFGIAMMEELVRLTASGVPVGTPAYLSPEQVKGERADVRSDVFSFGVLLYEISTGRLPFTGSSPSALMYKIVEGEYAPPESHASVEPELSQIIRRCLRQNPSARFANAGEIVEALRPLLQRWRVVDPRATLANYVVEGNLLRERGDSPSDNVPTVGTPKLPLKRRRLTSLAVAGVALAVVAGAAGFIAVSPQAAVEARLVDTAPGNAFASTVTQGAEEGAPQQTGALETERGSVAASPAAQVERPSDSSQATRQSAAAVEPEATSRTAPPPELAEIGRRGVPPPSVAERPTRRQTRPSRYTPEPPPAIAAPLAPGTVELVLQGGWADILVDGKPKGRSPPVRSITLPPGEHLLELRNPYRAPFRKTIRVEPGLPVTVRAELEAASAAD